MPRCLLRGFTLVELLVVIAIIGILVALLLPAIQAAREAARRTQCINGLKQLGLAAHSYLSARKDVLPAGFYHEGSASAGEGDTFFVHLLPFMEEQAVYDRWDFKNRINNSAMNDSPAATLISGLICPSDNPVEKVCHFISPVTSGSYNMHYPGYYAITSYAGNHGSRNYFAQAASTSQPTTDDGMFYVAAPESSATTSGVPYPPSCGTGSDPPCRYPTRGVALKSVTDGTSNTIMFGEKYNYDPNFDAMPPANRSGLLIHQWALWGWTGGTKATGHVTRSSNVEINLQSPASCATSPTGYGCQDYRLMNWGSGHPGGANLVFADGSSRFMADSTSLVTLQALSTRNGADTITE